MDIFQFMKVLLALGPLRDDFCTFLPDDSEWSKLTTKIQDQDEINGRTMLEDITYKTD